jgi:hypothetical protein
LAEAFLKLSNVTPMNPTLFNLGKTETYISRPACWVPGGSLPCDGFVTVTCVKRNGDCDGPHTYGVKLDQLDRVTVWKLPDGDEGEKPSAVKDAKAKGQVKPRPYVGAVTATGYRCNCRARVGCKHGDCVTELRKRKLI